MGMPIHNVEMTPGKGGQICRSAGCMATIVNKQKEHAIVRLPSGVSLAPPGCRSSLKALWIANVAAAVMLTDLSTCNFQNLQLVLLGQNR